MILSLQQSVFSGAVSASGKMANLLNTEPQTQIGIEKADTELHISASIHGAGINVIVVKQV